MAAAILADVGTRQAAQHVPCDCRFPVFRRAFSEIGIDRLVGLVADVLTDGQQEQLAADKYR